MNVDFPMTEILKKISLLTGLFCAVSFSSAAVAQTTEPDSLSINEAIHLALKNQPQLKEIDAELRAAKASVSEAKSLTYPQVDLEAGASHIDPVPSFSLNPEEPPQNLEPRNPLDAHFAARQLIYDFGKTRANIALARSKTLTARQRMAVKKWTISYFTVQTYYSALYLQNKIKVERRQIQTLKEDLNLAKKRFKNGSATKYDVLSLKVRIAEENNDKLDLQGQKKKMGIILRNLFGWKARRPVQLSERLELAQKKPSVRPGQVSYAKRPDYSVLKQEKQVARQRYKLSGKGSRPVISADATAGYKNGYIKDIDRLFANWSVGVDVKVPLFNGYRTRSRKQQAKAHIESIEAKTQQLQRKIDSQVQQAYVDVQTGLKKIATADLQIKQAKEQLRLAKLRYRKGVITNTELLTSETALARARLQKVTAKYHILINQYELKKAAGRNIWSHTVSN